MTVQRPTPNSVDRDETVDPVGDMEVIESEFITIIMQCDMTLISRYIIIF
jgi:hypothetical protein